MEGLKQIFLLIHYCIDSSVSMKMMRGEVSAKTTYQRTSTGPIAISEVCPEGKFLTLENTSNGANRRVSTEYFDITIDTVTR